ncbi:MAG: AAA domain-containing protein [Nitrospinae bacterium]|nr:AAA domain-containing protein [Nitrospinota bacterium]MZH40297.1 AAA domain-containing protein [Nitrospinota bacterium]MZH45956.1 AAA domain-containing protein [Nitrospinota bacterium]
MKTTTKKSIEIDGVTLHLSKPDSTRPEWIGQDEVLKQIEACWMVVSEKDFPLSPRITGMPGTGKTTLAMVAANQRKQPLYIFQCTSDTRPEDLLITPVLSEHGKISYHASPLVCAMIEGGICILDEGNRMNEKSWASLAPLLDHRRYVESIIAGIQIHAHREFRACVTMNNDESTFEIPDYILSRLQPTLQMTMPSYQDELDILRYHLPFSEEELLKMTTDFLQKSHQLELDFSPRDGIHILQYALKRISQNKESPLAKDELWKEAVSKVLGEEALDLDALAARNKRALGDERLPMGLGDFFFNDDSPLHPDSDQ